VAFSLPALQKLLAHPPTVEGRGPRVLILTPTRELAGQITNAIAGLSKFANFRFGIITGGVAYPAQEQLLRRPLDILIATPGRLMDHMSRNRVDFSRLEMFILDEADRMLDMGFVKDMEHIAQALPPEHQTLLFSATLEGEVQRISRKFLKNPVCIQLTVATKKHTLISQRVHLVDNWNHKRALLSHILEEADVWQAIVFTATKRGADDLVEELSSRGVICAALHGDMKQSKRSRTLEQMHRGKLRVLVATDVAARGLDVKKLSHVVNFDLPRTGEDYVHRIGRTGRCGEKGVAISLVGPKDGALLAQIERFTAQKLERHVIPGFEPRTTFNLNSMSSKPKSKAKTNKRRTFQSSNSKHTATGFGKSAKSTSFRYREAHGKR
jgi:superfamily II DNA/RNA helicase